MASLRVGGENMTEVFDCKAAEDINKARLDHLASMGLDLSNKTVLEVGAGIGKLTGFFEERNCHVLSTEARPDNVKVFRDRYPKRHVELVDLNVPGSHIQFGFFDIVFMYGTLYHLSSPSLSLSDLARVCTGILLLETMVSPQDDGLVNPWKEKSSTVNQSADGLGCRPGRDWVMKELKKNFPFVYATLTQPIHKEYPLCWPAVPGVNCRSIFVASKAPLKNTYLTESLPKIQTQGGA